MVPSIAIYWQRCIAIAALTFLLAFNTKAQEIQPDDYCVNLGDPFPTTLLDNDVGVDPTTAQVQVVNAPPCITVLETGTIIWNEPLDEECCGTYQFFYIVTIDGQFFGEAPVNLEIKCDSKPDCSLIDLEPFVGGVDDGVQDEARCVSVCELSTSTLYLPFDPGFTYNWTVPGGFTPGDNDAQIIVDWGLAGSSWIQVEVIDENGIPTVYFICVDILEGPNAEFVSTAYACLDAPMTFENLYPYAASYSWDFGDGTTVLDDGQFVQHTYSAPGTYTVVLSATIPVYGGMGETLCCCTQEFEMDVVVDELPGPQISCVSTLCEGDAATYTTDATGCDSYLWTVEDADGNTVTILSGQGTNTIDVVWGSGPFGTVTLEVTGCDEDYCDSPTTVYIPIISSNGVVAGPDVVCAGTTYTYSVPKWLATAYAWNVTGGVIIGDANMHTVTVEWGSGPIGLLDVQYQSDFLIDLDAHDASDCQGTANLDVDILPEFALGNLQPQVCVGETTTIFATSVPSTAYTWSIDPSIPFTDLGGAIQVDWTVAPGTYVITAESTDGAYCNTLETTAVQVIEVAPPASLSGPLEICPGGTALYTGTTSEPGTILNWSVTGGSPAFGTGLSLEVTWDPTGPYEIQLTQAIQSPIFCSSDPIIINPVAVAIVEPLVISGGGDCTNSIASYTLSTTQPADAEIFWDVMDPIDGSIISGQGTYDIDVQWNNTPGPAEIQLTVTLCGISVTESYFVNLNAATVPVVTQTGNLCPGGSATLSAPGAFTSWDWSTGDTGSSTSISSAGLYSLTTVDLLGCEATVFYTAEEYGVPVASISTPDSETICLNNPNDVTLVAQTEPNYEFTWYCNGVLVQGPSAVSTYTHAFMNTAGTYNYYFEVENTLTGCTNTSDIITVTEEICNGDGCVAESYSVNPSAVLQSPNCNQVQFDTAPVNFTPTQWIFDDGTSSLSPAPLHTYLEASCYLATVKGTVPAVGGGFCSVQDTVSICVPLVADFTFEIVDCREVVFTNASTFLGAPFGTPISSVAWDFGPGTSTSYNETFIFPTSGTFPVTLTVFNSSGCEASITKNVELNSVGVPTISVSDLSPCAGESVTFVGSASNAVTYTWDFGNGATYVGASPQQSFDVDGTYTVTLTAEDANGCTDTATIFLDVHPAIPPQEITGDLIICEGELTTLMAPPGFGYSWNTGASSQSINVGPGSYSVTLLDGNNCTLELGPVEVEWLPAPELLVTGDNYICDAGCVDLLATFISGATYQWYDQGGNPVLGAVSNFFQVCDTEVLPNAFTVEVTDMNGCVFVSDPFPVELVASPVVSILASGTLCEGDPNVLTVDPVDPSLQYLWSNGETGDFITVSAAGDYTVTAIDPVSGCTGNATITVNPLPDVCSVPVGCYKNCDPIEVCVATGLGDYQWNFNGVPIPGETGNCILLSETGVYSLTLTQGDCSITSGDLEMIIEPCDDDPCDTLEFDYAYAQTVGGLDSCCVNLSYTMDEPTFYSIRFTSADAGLAFDPGTLDPDFSTQSNTVSEVRIAGLDPSQMLPQGSYTEFMTLCVQDPVAAPQTVLVEWLGEDGLTLCTDSILFDCPAEPDCLYLANDTAYCEDGMTYYSFTACNPLDNPYSIGYIEMTPISPLGIVITPSGIDLSGDPIDPGECQTIIVELSGLDIGGETFCYSMVAHETNPALDPTTPCCSLEEVYCIDLPQCEPCTDVFVADILPVDNQDGCCYEIVLGNDYAPDFFDAIQVLVLSPSTTFTVDNPVGSGWFTTGFTGTDVTFVPDGSPNLFVPLGLSSLPELCIDTDIAPQQQLLIQWMRNGEVECEELIEVFCEPDCGYLYDVQIDCDPATNSWLVSANLQNTADYTVSEAVISFDAGSGLTGYNETIVLGPVSPNTSSGIFSFDIGAPAQPGDIICFNVTIHEVSTDGLYLSCCTFQHCIELPDCGFSVSCECDDSFYDAVAQGINIVDLGSGTYEISLAGLASFNPECDGARWVFGDGTATGLVSPLEVQTHTFDPGSYLICVKIFRTDADGNVCPEKICVTLDVPEFMAAGMIVYPNPNNGQFTIKMGEIPEGETSLDLVLFDYMQRPVHIEQVAIDSQTTRVPISLSEAVQGIYLLQIRVGSSTVTEKVYIAR